MPRAAGTTGKSGKGAAPPPTLEGLNDDQRYSLTEEHRKKYDRLLAAKKKADADLRNHCKIIKAELGADGLQDIKDIEIAGTPEGEAQLKADIERKIRVLRWMQVPIGTNGELFPSTDRTPLTERAFNLGKRHALAGETRNNPHHHTVDAHRSYNEGYDKGQEEKVLSGIKPLGDTPKGSVPKEQWAKDLREQNEAVERDIKQAGSIGTKSPSFKVN